MIILTQLSLSLSELLGIAGVLGMMLAVWIDARIRISGIEIKLKALSGIVENHSADNQKDFMSCTLEMKEQASETRAEVKALGERIHELHILVEQNINYPRKDTKK